MKETLMKTAKACAVAAMLTAYTAAHAKDGGGAAGKSPWGPRDEIGALNMMTDASRLGILKRVSGGKVYDLAVDLFVGMPSCCVCFGDPTFQIWMTHRPARGEGKELLSHSSDSISMLTHIGTHIDGLNCFGLKGRIWNRVSADDALGVRGWTRSGADKYPPIVARGVLIDVAASKKMAYQPPSYAITVADLQEALKKQGTRLSRGDVVLIRTGLMKLWPDGSKYRLKDQAGLSLEAAKWLIEQQKAMLLGADNFGLESFPSKNPRNVAPVHSYLLAERGVSIMEVLWLEELSRDRVYEFLFIASPLKLRGATGAPIRPLALPVRPKE